MLGPGCPCPCPCPCMAMAGIGRTSDKGPCCSAPLCCAGGAAACCLCASGARRAPRRCWISPLGGAPSLSNTLRLTLLTLLTLALRVSCGGCCRPPNPSRGPAAAGCALEPRPACGTPGASGLPRASIPISGRLSNPCLASAPCCIPTPIPRPGPNPGRVFGPSSPALGPGDDGIANSDSAGDGSKNRCYALYSSR